MRMDMNKGSNQWVAILVIIVLIVGAWYVGRKQAINASFAPDAIEGAYLSDNSDTTDKNGRSPEAGASAARAGSEFVQVADQPAGMEVKVSSLALSEMGWVGIRDDEGRVLGAGRFDAGNFADVTVPLLRATVAGDSYQALLYVDDGDRAFDLKKDALIIGPDGDVAGTNFKAL